MRHSLKTPIKTKVGLQNRQILIYGSAGLFSALLLFGGFFFFNMLGNTENSKAEINTNATFRLFPNMPTETENIKSDVSFSCLDDSLFITVICNDKFSITNSVINVTGVTAQEDSVNFHKTYTLKGARKISEIKYQYTIPTGEYPEIVIIETSVTLREKENPGTISSSVELMQGIKFLQSEKIFIPQPSGLNINNATTATASANWLPVENTYKYKIRYRPIGNENWIYGTVMAPGVKRPIVNLKPSTTYEFQVQAFIKNAVIDSTGYCPRFIFSTQAKPLVSN